MARATLDGAPTAPAPTAPPPAVPAPPLPEAPCSVNCYLTLEGRQVQVTLRDTDERRGLARLATLLRQYPVAPPLPQPPAPGPAQPVPAAIPSCTLHGPMKPSTKQAGHYFCPAKLADGAYCQAKA